MINKHQAQWFFLRGLAREAGHWGEFLDDMKLRFPLSEMYAIDPPGVGRHFRSPALWSIADNARFMRREFARLRKPELPAYIVAVSLGAMVAVEWLHQDSAGIDGAVLMNTSFRGVSPIYRRLWYDSYPHLLKALAAKDPEQSERHVLSMISNRPGLHDETARAWAKIRRERPISHETFFRQLTAAALYEPPLHPPLVPVLLLNSLADRMVHPSCSEAIAEHWDCELRRHPTAGHDLPLDAGPWVINRIASWIEAVSEVKPKENLEKGSIN